ncbi:MAG: hypothetical protein EZS28_023181 [Streblomastix strix]|uniref:TmcB/TmcC TPR repeats domain-containing protein n=1 Tax=Streblomastix strix TaxID=222440 RepID=A0A5J4VFE5_9EUKA|nr:MAG: hypothetical protein EZS28_023181 [Streblomastix strix]
MADSSSFKSSQSYHITPDGSKQFSKIDQAVFNFFIPLYDQTKRRDVRGDYLHYCVCSLMLLMIQFFRLDTQTWNPPMISKQLGFVDGSAYGFLLHDMSPILSIVCFGVILLCWGYIIPVVIFFRKIVGSQKWMIEILRGYFMIAIALYIPLCNIFITSFDCHKTADGILVLNTGTCQCFGNNTLQILGAIFGIVGLCFITLQNTLYSLLIFHFNPKNGGPFAKRKGNTEMIMQFLILFMVLAMRLLSTWWFWRLVVVVISSGIMIYLTIYNQPHYKLIGNTLYAIIFIGVAVIRLFLEIGYLIERSTQSIIPTIVFMIVGIGLWPVGGFIVFKLTKKRQHKLWLLNEDLQPLIQFGQDELGNQQQSREMSIKSLPKLKNPFLVEQQLRFLGESSEFRNTDMLNYADIVYNHALRRNKKNAQLMFDYGTFLEAYKKNTKSNSVYMKCLQGCEPDFCLRFVLFCKQIESQQHALNNTGHGKASSGMMSLTFEEMLSTAEQHHEDAKTSLKEFWQNLASVNMSAPRVPQLLKRIVDNEAKARRGYEELLVTHPNSLIVLREYARLLLDIYQDEDTAEQIIQRAE